MRSSVVSFTCAAGALVVILSCAARAAVEGGMCCDTSEESKSEESKSATPDMGVAGAGGGARAEAASPPVPSLLRPTGLADAASYSDAFRVLSQESSCSRFFGGPRLALTILNGFAPQLRGRPLGQGGVGIRMSGGYDIYRDGATGVTYRLFKEAFINSDGPFLMRVVRPQSARLRVGRFEAETRQAKVLLLLHEMGHLVGTPGGGWLLPDDGGDAEQSERNTRTVESQCLKQLLALGA
jgi:hypothetical protein